MIEADLVGALVGVLSQADINDRSVSEFIFNA